MKNHKMTFTTDQLASIMDACGWAINDNYSMSDPTNAHYQRIINKIRKELEATTTEFNFNEIETEEA